MSAAGNTGAAGATLATYASPNNKEVTTYRRDVGASRAGSSTELLDCDVVTDSMMGALAPRLPFPTGAT